MKKISLGSISLPDNQENITIVIGILLGRTDIPEKMEWLNTHYPSARITVNELRHPEGFTEFNWMVGFDDDASFVHYKMTHD
jgi:hypothetical protein